MTNLSMLFKTTLILLTLIIGIVILNKDSDTPRTDATIYPLEWLTDEDEDHYYTDQRVSISFDDFTVQKTLKHSFEDYPIESIYYGPIAELDTTSSDFASIFPTRIRNQLEEGANFAGHYSIMMAGCGTGCQAIAITDVITGDVVGETSSRAGAEYYEDSQLLILDGADDGICLTTDICNPSYYVMLSGTLVELD